MENDSVKNGCDERSQVKLTVHPHKDLLTDPKTSGFDQLKSVVRAHPGEKDCSLGTQTVSAAGHFSCQFTDPPETITVGHFSSVWVQ